MPTSRTRVNLKKQFTTRGILRILSDIAVVCESWKTDQKAEAHYDWSVIPPGFELSFASEPNNKTKYQNNSEQQNEENEENYYFGNYALSQCERKIAKANIKKTSVVRC